MKIKETRGRKPKHKFSHRKNEKTFFDPSPGTNASAHSWAKKNGYKIRTWVENGVRIIVRVK